MKWIFLIFCLFSLRLHALSTSAHRDLTVLALKEFRQCTEGSWFPFRENILIEANVQEDTNLAKLFQYSHFYHPQHRVTSPWPNPFERCPSNYRVSHIEYALEAYFSNSSNIEVAPLWDDSCEENFFYHYLGNEYSFSGERQRKAQEFFGAIIHHLQDMASPTHVVPIAHSLNDGFESYAREEKIVAEIERASGTCVHKKARLLPPSTLLHLAALETQRNLNDEVPILVVLPGGQIIPKTVTWKSWYGGENFSFQGIAGDYGTWGNNFGILEFSVQGGQRIRVDQEIYDDFLRQQYRQALEYSKMALEYFSERMRRNSPQE